MSATEIIKELPNLTQTEMRMIRRRLLELSCEFAEIEACNQAATEGALLLDRMEEEDARGESR
jgi:hypothetical protein